MIDLDVYEYIWIGFVPRFQALSCFFDYISNIYAANRVSSDLNQVSSDLLELHHLTYLDQ